MLISGVVVAIVATVFGAFTLAGSSDGAAPYVETKPDPMAGTPGTERPGFIKANAGCEDHELTPWDERDFGLDAEVVLEGLDSPTTLEFYSQDVAFIGQRDGLVLRWDLTTNEATPVIDLTDSTATEQDQGLVGLAVTPDGSHLLINFTTEGESKLVAQPLVEDGMPTVTGRVDVLTVEQPSSQHNGGTIAFDAEGTLWASFGDGGGQGDKYQNAQDPMTPLGAMLRIELGPELEVAGAPGNPYLDGAEGHPWVFATGIRNPFRFSIDPVTGIISGTIDASVVPGPYTVVITADDGEGGFVVDHHDSGHRRAGVLIEKLDHRVDVGHDPFHQRIGLGCIERGGRACDRRCQRSS